MDFSIMLEYIDYVVMLACLAVGYIIKHSTFCKKINNDDIPAILAVIGLVMNLFVSGFTIKSAVMGVTMGLLSTGLHQAYKRFIESWGNK